MTISHAEAEQLRTANFLSCPACGRPTVTTAVSTVIDSQDGTTDYAWFARCAGLSGPVGLLRGIITHADTGASYHLEVRLGDRDRFAG